jgi:ribosomal protein S12 methylthiotransferase accessory factor
MNELTLAAHHGDAATNPEALEAHSTGAALHRDATAAPVIARSADGAPAVSVPAAVQAWLQGGTVTANVGFDLDFESRQLAEAARDRRQLLSIRFGSEEALIGPRWVPGHRAACAGCAEIRMRRALGHPLASRPDLNATPRSGWPVAVLELATVGLDHLGRYPLGPGEMLSIGLMGTRRHRVMPAVGCPVCGHGARLRRRNCNGDPGAQAVRAQADVTADLGGEPSVLDFQSRPSRDPVPLRGAPSAAISPRELAKLVDPRVGPVLQVQRDHRAPFAMSGAILPGSRDRGYGRGRDFEAAAAVAILEAYERLGALPHEEQVIRDVCYRDVAGLAVDPDTLGRYSEAQLDHPNCRVLAYGPDIAMDWVFGYQLRDGTARLLPADVAFYGYDYRHRVAGAPKAERPDHRVNFFAESSSGCALGSSLEEAALHALCELVERDAFLLAWCRRTPLPAISFSSVDDPASAMLGEGIEARGFDVHLLVTTYDVGLPSVWAVAVNRSPDAVPATLSAAGSNAEPAVAVRAALWELAQLVARPLDWDVAGARRLVDDPSRVESIDDHVHLYARPETRERVGLALGGPEVSLGEAFPGWPGELCLQAAGDVRGALDYLLAQTAGAGLDEALVVDQSSEDHRDLGLSVARVVVPGMLPMCFGAAHQRLGGLARREAVIIGDGRDADTEALFDPHPFP